MSAMPLKSLEIILTRAAHQIESSAQRFEELGIQVIRAPSIRLAEPPPLDHSVYERGQWMLPKYDLGAFLWRFDWVIFTSVNAVKFAQQAWLKQGGLKKALAHQNNDQQRARRTKVACIGESTSTYLNHLGIKVDLQPKEYHAESLLQAFKSYENQQELSQQRFLIPRALVAREILPNALRALGAEVWICPLYQTLDAEISPTCKQRIIKHSDQALKRAILFTSNSTLKGFSKQFSEQELNHIKREYDTFVIGPVIRKAALTAGFNIVAMAQPHTMQGLIEAVIHHYSKVEN